MEKIKVLSSDVIDQIAAGEVVERPAHLVKELLENSIDAGATEIEIEFSNGGRNLVVSDNGSGMSKVDLPLSLSRHATSKIAKSDDLWKLSSFGFRGEALASASAVSEFKITSKMKSGEAYQVDSTFGKIGEVISTRSQQGTRVEVSQLFENVPARLKFLKTEAAESLQIKKVLKAIALSHPSISFKTKQNGKLLFFWQGTDNLLHRVEDVIGIEGLFYTQGTYGDFKTEVVYSSPHQTQRNSQGLWFFVQNRWVQDRTLQASVVEAYRQLLMHGEYPFVVAFITCPPENVDVNIHPTKAQVKFLNQSDSFRALNRPLREALEKAPWVGDMIGASDSSYTSNSQTEFIVSSSVSDISPAENLTLSGHDSAFEKATFKMKSISSPTRSETNIKSFPEESAEKQISIEPKWGSLQVLGQANLTYVVTQSRRGLILVDQHAAHERIAFEKLMKNWREGAQDIQQSLIPLTLEFEEHFAEALIAHEKDFQRMGISLSSVGPTTIAVDAHPALIRDKAIASMLEKAAVDITTKGDSFAMENGLADIFATLACHSVIRAGQALSVEEMKELLVAMDEFPLSSFCPHGRPVFVEIPFEKLDRDFGRIV